MGQDTAGGKGGLKRGRAYLSLKPAGTSPSRFPPLLWARFLISEKREPGSMLSKDTSSSEK